MARLHLTLPADVYTLLKCAAERERRTVADFVVDAATNAALQIMDEAVAVRLSPEDQQLLAESILHPKPPTDSLRRAFHRRATMLTAL